MYIYTHNLLVYEPPVIMSLRILINHQLCLNTHVITTYTSACGGADWLRTNEVNTNWGRCKRNGF